MFLCLSKGLFHLIVKNHMDGSVLCSSQEKKINNNFLFKFIAKVYLFKIVFLKDIFGLPPVPLLK